MKVPPWFALNADPSRLRDALCDDEFAADLRALTLARGEPKAGSYVHDNGFRKIVLATGDGEAAKLTIHHWASDGCRPRGNVHNHRWDFVSVIACGRLVSVDWRDDPGGELFKRYRYQSPGVGTDYALVEDGAARIKAASEIEWPTGSAYFQPHSVLHQAWGDPGTVTVVAQGPVAQTKTTVLTARELASGAHGTTALTREELHDSLDTLSRALAALGHV